MRNIRNISGFYDALNNETFKKDPLWYQHIGTESSPGVYIDDGSMKVSGKMIADERKALAKVRELLGIKKKTYQQTPQRDAVRLMVTYYQKFNLNNRQIAKLLEFSDSTLRHDYPPLKPGEQIHPAYVLKLRDNFGKQLTK